MRALAAIMLVSSCGARTEGVAPEPELPACPRPFATASAFALAGEEVIVASGGEIIALRKTDGARRVILRDVAAGEIAANARYVAWSTAGGGVDRVRIDGSERRTLHTPYAAGWYMGTARGLIFDTNDDLLFAFSAHRGATRVWITPVSGATRYVELDAPIAPSREALIGHEAVGSYYGYPRAVVYAPCDGSPTRALFEDEFGSGPPADSRSIVANNKTACATIGRSDLLEPTLARYFPAVRCMSLDGKVEDLTVLGQGMRASLAIDEGELFIGIGHVRYSNSFVVEEETLRIATRRLGISQGRAATLLHCRAKSGRSAPRIAVDAQFIWLHVDDGALYRIDRPGARG